MTKKPPVFGPNGAVLNSDTMSDELREQYKNASKMRTIHLRDALPLIGCVILFGAPFLWLVHILGQENIIAAVVMALAVIVSGFLISWLRKPKQLLNDSIWTIWTAIIVFNSFSVGIDEMSTYTLYAYIALVVWVGCIVIWRRVTRHMRKGTQST